MSEPDCRYWGRDPPLDTGQEAGFVSFSFQLGGLRRATAEDARSERLLGNFGAGSDPTVAQLAG